jgi:hypothetical protein
MFTDKTISIGIGRMDNGFVPFVSETFLDRTIPSWSKLRTLPRFGRFLFSMFHKKSAQKKAIGKETDEKWSSAGDQGTAPSPSVDGPQKDPTFMS